MRVFRLYRINTEVRDHCSLLRHYSLRLGMFRKRKLGDRPSDAGDEQQSEAAPGEKGVDETVEHEGADPPQGRGVLSYARN